MSIFEKKFFFLLFSTNLCTNKFFPFLVSQHKVGVYVIRSNRTIPFRKSNPRLIVRFDIRIAILENILLSIRILSGAIVETIR